MLAKVFRIFCGGYIADPLRLQAKNYRSMQLRAAPYLPVLATHGLAQLKGTVRKEGVLQAGATVRSYQRENGALIWSTRTNQSGQYRVLNIANGLECYVVALDPNNDKNASIKDRQVSK